MATISSVGGSSFHQTQIQARKRDHTLPLEKEIDFVFIFKFKGVNLSGTDKAVAQLLFNSTKCKSIVEFTYEMLERKLDKCQRTIYRSLKKLEVLFIIDFFRSKVNSLGYREYNILRVQRVPDFYQIINQLSKQ